MRAQPDRIAFGPSVGRRPGGRHRAVLAAGITVLLVSALLVAVSAHLLAGRSAPPAADPVSGTPRPSTRTEPPRASPAAPVEADDAGVPSKESAHAAAAFVDAWLTKDHSQRLDRLKDLAVTSLYEGLTYTDQAEIPTAHRVGSPRVENAGSYLVRYRVTLSDGSMVLVSTVYDGTLWLVASVDPAGR